MPIQLTLEVEREVDKRFLAEDDASKRETGYLARSEPMKKWFLEAIARDGEGAVPLEEARQRLGLTIG